MGARFYFPGGLPQQDEVMLPEATAHHALRVLRLTEGASVVVFDGEGGEATGVLSLRGKACFVVNLVRSMVERESPLRLVLVQALASGDKMDWVIQKAVELGAIGVIPLQGERSVLKLSGERAVRRVAHWNQIAVAACEQSGRNRVPHVEPVSDLHTYLTMHQGVTRLMFAPGGEPLTRLSAPETEVHILIGPEGGWSDSECRRGVVAGCQMIGMGPRVLRTETAGLAVLAAMQSLWGDF